MKLGPFKKAMVYALASRVDALLLNLQPANQAALATATSPMSSACQNEEVLCTAASDSWLYEAEEQEKKEEIGSYAICCYMHGFSSVGTRQWLGTGHFFQCLLSGKASGSQPSVFPHQLHFY